MPTYTYECRGCGHRFEEFHSITDEKPRRCPECKKRAVRVPSGGAGLLFKGSGFYITDYRSSSYREQAKQDKTSSGGGDAKPASTGGDAKPASSGTSGGDTKPAAPKRAGKSGSGSTGGAA